MKLAIILARSTADSGHASVVGVPMPYADAATIFKDHVARREMPDGCAAAGFNVLELWTAAGVQKKKRLADLPAPSAPVEESGDQPDQSETSDQTGAPSQPAPPSESGHENVSGDPVELMAARIEADGTVSAEALGTLTVPQLKALAVRYELAIPGDANKAEIIQLFLAEED